MSLLSDMASPTPIRRSPISGSAKIQRVTKIRPGTTNSMKPMPMMTPRTTAATANAPIWSKLCMSAYSAGRSSRTRRRIMWKVIAYIQEYARTVTTPTTSVKAMAAPKPVPGRPNVSPPTPAQPSSASPTSALTTPTITAATRAVTASGPQSSRNRPHAWEKHLPMSMSSSLHPCALRRDTATTTGVVRPGPLLPLRRHARVYPQGLPQNSGDGGGRHGSGGRYGRVRRRLGPRAGAARLRPACRRRRPPRARAPGRGSAWRKGADPAAITAAAVAALGGMQKFVRRGDDVVIKPNLCTGYHGPEYAATTNPDVVGQLVGLCRAAGAKRVRVMDSPFGSTADEAYDGERRQGRRREGRRHHGAHGAGPLPQLPHPRRSRHHRVAHLRGRALLRRAHQRAHRQGPRPHTPHARRQEPARRRALPGRPARQHRPAHGRPHERLPALRSP